MRAKANIYNCRPRNNFSGVPNRRKEGIYEFQAKIGGGLCGADCVEDFGRWYLAEELGREVEFIVYDREGFGIGGNRLMKIKTVLNYHSDNVSSSEIRGRIKNSEDVSKLLPEEVLGYLKKMELYENGAA